MDGRGSAATADSRRRDAALYGTVLADDVCCLQASSHIVTERTTSVGDVALNGGAFCPDAYYIMESHQLPPALPTPDEESVAIFSRMPAFVSTPPSGFEDSPIERATVGGIHRELDEGQSISVRSNEADRIIDKTGNGRAAAVVPQKPRTAKDNGRRNSSEEDETSKTVTWLPPTIGNSKQLVADIRQFFHLNSSPIKLPAAAAQAVPWTGSNWSNVVVQQPSLQTGYTASIKHYAGDQQSSESSVTESLQRSRRHEALPPQLSEQPKCPIPSAAGLHELMTEEGGLRKPTDLQTNFDFGKHNSPGSMLRDRMLGTQCPLNSDAHRPAFAGTRGPLESTVPAAYLKTDSSARKPEAFLLEAIQSDVPDERIPSSGETIGSISVRQGLILGEGVHPVAKEKGKTNNDVLVAQESPLSRTQLAQIRTDGKTSCRKNASTQFPSTPTVTETSKETMGSSNSTIENPEKLAINLAIDLIPPPVEFMTEDQPYANASQTDDQSTTSKDEQSSIQGIADNGLYPTKDSVNSTVINTARTPNLSTAVCASMMISASNGFRASNTRSLMRPKLPPPEPPSRLDNYNIESSKVSVESSSETRSVRELLCRRDRNYDTVDRISLCQYGRDTALAMLQAETVTIRVKASSTANLVEAIGLSPRFSARPEPPRRSCSIPRKPSTHSLTELVRVDPDGSSDDLQKQFPVTRVSTNSNNTPAMFLRNDSFLRSSTIKAFESVSGINSEHVKPTAQIRPSAIRSISSTGCSGGKYFPNVESLIQQYSQTDAIADITGEFKTTSKCANRGNGSKSSGSTSKFGTLRGRLRDYVTSSNTKKQTYSYSASSKTLSHAKDKNGSKANKSQTGSWEPKPTDYQSDQGESTPPESSSDTKPSYISSYLSFAGPKPYMPPRTVSSLVTTKNEDQPSLTSTFRTFLGARMESCSSLASDKDSLTKFRTEASSQSLTGSPSSSGSPPDSKIDMINEWLESRSVDCNSPLFDLENQSPTKLESLKTESGPDEPFFRAKESSFVFTREPPSNMATFRTSGSISVHPSFIPSGNLNKATSPGNSRRPVLPGVTTSPGITNRPAILCAKKVIDHRHTLPRNFNRRSRNFSESEETTVRSPVFSNPSPFGNKPPDESEKVAEKRPNGVKELPTESAFETTDCMVTELVQRLRSTFSEETDKGKDFAASKEGLVVLTRQFVADSQNLVSSATQDRDRLVQSVTVSSATLSRIVDNCIGTTSAMGPTSQAVILNNRVIDLICAYRATMTAARVAVGKPLSCAEMKVLMKQATSLAAILSSLIKLLNRL